MKNEISDFLDFFKTIPDHRVKRTKRYKVEEILLLTFCGMIAGCEGWNDIEAYGKTKLRLLKKYSPFKSGIPSDDTLRRFFRVLDPKKFEGCFIDWVKSFQLDLEKKVIAFDGKTSRRSFEGDGKCLHTLSAFASELGISLGQIKVNEKSNEIKAIPELLELLDLKKSIVTIDALGCQIEIAKKITKKEADYIFGLKGNQGNLREDVENFFDRKLRKFRRFCYKKTVKGHGRIETRKCVVVENIDWLRKRHPKWDGLKTIIEIESTREIKGEKAVEKRFYISSLSANARQISNAIQQHWGIENKLHWVLDVSFNDDLSRIRQGNAPSNIVIVKKVVLNLMRMIKPLFPRVSFKQMKKLAGWDDQFLHSVLSAKL